MPNQLDPSSSVKIKTAFKVKASALEILKFYIWRMTEDFGFKQVFQVILMHLPRNLDSLRPCHFQAVWPVASPLTFLFQGEVESMPTVQDGCQTPQVLT